MTTVTKEARESSSSLSPTPPPDYSVEDSPKWKEKSQTVTKPGDDDLVSAAEALTQLTNTANSPGSGSMTANSSPGPSENGNSPPMLTNQHPLVTHVNQVTKHPIVTNALKYYETSKRNYAPFNYAAEIVEKAAMPVVNKIELNLNYRHQKRKESESSSSGSGSKKRRFPRDGEENKSVSIETKKRLQFCLHVLHLANDHINDSVNFLQQKITDREQVVKNQREEEIKKQQQVQEKEQEKQQLLDYGNDNKIQTEGHPNLDIPSQEAQQTKTEIATTVKKIIHLISNFKPSSLSPDGLSPASSNTTVSSVENNDLKANIRDIILKLPSTIHQSALSNTTSSQANDKIFVFAKESLDMITKLTNVFNEQLVKAETWVGGEELVSSASTLVSNPASDSPSPSTATTCEELQPNEKRVKIDNMTEQLNLREDELSQIKSSWSSLQANNKYHKDQFMPRLFSNLLTANPELKSTFANGDTIQNHCQLFGDMLSYVISYIDDCETLDEFIYHFVREHNEFAKESVSYLEPMGLAFVQTFKQWLGNGKFDNQLEMVWIKVYIYMANSLLVSVDDGSDSDVASTFSNEVKSESEPEETDDVQPLNIKKTDAEEDDVPPRSIPVSTSAISPMEAPVAPAAPVSAPVAAPVAALTELDKSNTIQFTLKSNEKYRGFRRNDETNTPQAEPISVKIPTNTTFQKVHTPASTSSNMSASLSSLLATGSTATLSSAFNTPPATPFDPRKSKRMGRSPISSSASSINEDFDYPVKSPLRRSDAEEDSANVSYSTIQLTSVDQSPVEALEEPHAVVAQDDEPPSLLKKLQGRQQPKVVVDSSSEDEEEEEEVKYQPKFDPRRRHRRTKSVLISSPESSEVDEQEETKILKETHDNSYFLEAFEEASIDLDTKELPSLPAIPVPRSNLDYNSFGIRGLAPILEATDIDEKSSKYESDADDNASSNYGEESVNDRSSTDEVSSGVSTLSLHNSDYRSSISSGTDNASSPVLNKFQIETRQVSQSSQYSDVSYIKPLSEPVEQKQKQLKSAFTNTHSSSSSSLLLGPNRSQMSQNRASLGFMRSSFVLKKEMENLGFNQPENVFVKPPTIPAAMSSVVSLPSPSQTYGSSNSFETNGSSDEDCFDMLNAFGDGKNTPPTIKHKTSKMKRLNSMTSRIQQEPNISNQEIAAMKYKSMSIDPPKRRSLRKRLSSIFSSKSSSSTVASSNASVFAPSYRKSTMTFSTSDLVSINSVETKGSTFSGFSFMSTSRRSARRSMDTRSVHTSTRRGNKYKVKECPYDVFA